MRSKLRSYEPEEELGENRHVTIAPMEKSSDAIQTHPISHNSSSGSWHVGLCMARTSCFWKSGRASGVPKVRSISQFTSKCPPAAAAAAAASDGP